MSLTPTQLNELQIIVETLRTEFPNSDDALWEAAIRIQKGGLGPITGPGGQPAFDAAVADIVLEAEQIATVQGIQGGLGNSFPQAAFNVIPVEDNLPAGTLGGVIYLDVAPNTYAFTDVVELTPAGPNSVVLSEVGTQVARTVVAASGGLEFNNLSTGAGFERVLTTSDLGGGITVEDEGTPLPTLATTLDFVGAGVTATGAGATKTITIPGAAVAGADTQVQFNDAGVFGATPNLTWDDNTFEITNTTSSAPALQINLGNNPSVGMVMDSTLSTNYIALRMNDQTGANFFLIRHDYGLSTPNHELTIESSSGGTLMEFENEGNIWIPSELNTFGIVTTTATNQVRILNQATLMIQERAAAAADQAGYGQLYTLTSDGGLYYKPDGSAQVRLDVAGFDPTANQTISGDWTFTGQTIFNNPTDDVQLRPNVSLSIRNSADTSTTFVQNLGPTLQWGIAGADFGSGIFELGSSWSHLKMNRAIVFDEQASAPVTPVAGDGQLWVRNDAPNVLVFTDDTGVDTVLGAGGGGVNSVTGGSNITNSGTAADPILDVDDPIVVSSIHLTSALNPAAGSPYNNVPINIGANLVGTQGMTQLSRQRIQTRPSSFSFNATLFINSSGGDVSIGDPNGANVTVNNGVAVELQHTGAATIVAQTATPAAGGFQVNNLATGAGLERVLTTSDLGGGVTNPMTADLDGNGFDLDDMGVLFMREQASADPDVTTQGQLWVQTRPFSNQLMFTNDNGNDIIVAGLPDSDLSVGTNVIAGTGFVACANIGNVQSQNYMLFCNVEVTAPAADDILIQLTINTGSVFKGVLTYAGTGITGGLSQIESATGTVITNNVLVPTSGSASPNGTYVAIQGLLIADGVGQTISLRVAKNADTGADGSAVRAVIKAVPISNP